MSEFYEFGTQISTEKKGWVMVSSESVKRNSQVMILLEDSELYQIIL
jgi:hypothetical protein